MQRIILSSMPPKCEGICDRCGKNWFEDDDQPETVLQRLKVYHEQTKPLITYYQSKSILHSVDGTKDLDDVFAQIVKVLGE